MNLEQGNSCPLPTCPDTTGTLPSCAGLSVPYVPFQQKGSKKYSQAEALQNGTLFPSLNLPFRLKAEGSPVPDSPMAQLQALDLVVLELGTYLDTHPDDMEAFELFQEYVSLLREAKTAYEKKNGPLTLCSAADGPSFRWLQDPWPWNAQHQEVN